MTDSVALAWREKLNLRHSVTWVSNPASFLHHTLADFAGMVGCLEELFGASGFPMERIEPDVFWLRDILGKPYLRWQGEVQGWAERNNIAAEHLHVSNTHDGNAHLVFAAYDSRLVGVGIDVVALDRLRLPGKDRAYLHRFAGQFMSETEYTAFTELGANDDEERLRVRVAAHFSLMEAASKACGTGLKIGGGMGRRPEALPKQSIGVAKLEPEVILAWGERAHSRLAEIGATRWQGFWSHDGRYLVSAVVLYRE